MPGEDGLWLIQQLRRLKSEQGGRIRRRHHRAPGPLYSRASDGVWFRGLSDEACWPLRSVQNGRIPRRAL